MHVHTHPACCLRPWMGPPGQEYSQLCCPCTTFDAAKAADSASELWRRPDSQALRGLAPRITSLKLGRHLFWIPTALPSGSRPPPNGLGHSNIRLFVFYLCHTNVNSVCLFVCFLRFCLFYAYTRKRTRRPQGNDVISSLKHKAMIGR